MTVVALETSARPPSVAARHGGRTLERVLGLERRHASDLLPALEELLVELGAAPGGLETVVVGTGPGSYTGLRVGIATAQGLVLGTGATLVALPSLEALAWAELAPGERAHVLLDARANGVYHARYRRLEDEVETLVAPRVLPAAQAAEAVAGDERILGDETVAEAAGLDADTRARLTSGAVPGAAALLELGLLRRARGVEDRPEEVEPLYLRPFAARPRKR